MPKNDKTYTLNSIGAMLERQDTRLGNIEGKLGSVGTRLTNIEVRVEKIEKRLNSIEKDVQQLKNDVAELKIKNAKIEARLDSIDERTALIPMLYNNVDKFMREIIDNREFRSITDLRLERLELKTAHLTN